MKILCTVLAGASILLAIDTSVPRGKQVFVENCSGCHALDVNKVGPPLRGVYGRKAASVPGFLYSDALKSLNIRWDETSLDRWLTDPDAMAPDTDMGFRLADANERKAIIAYLKTLSK